MYDHDVFDAAVFTPMLEDGKPRSATASARPGEENHSAPERQSADLDALIHQSMLNFTSFMAADAGARVMSYERGYRVELGSQRFAFDMGAFRSLLERDNQGIDLSFSDELAAYEPDAELVRKSKVPLWVLKRVGGNVVVIQRIW